MNLFAQFERTLFLILKYLTLNVINIDIYTFITNVNSINYDASNLVTEDMKSLVGVNFRLSIFF